MPAPMATYASLSLPTKQFFASSGVAGVPEQIGVDLLGTFVLVVLVWFRELVRYRIAWAFRTLRCMVTRSGYILIWNDDSFAQSQKLVQHLKSEFPHGVVFRPLQRLDALRFYPLAPRRVRAIVLLDTDVTKLDSDTKHAELIEKRLRQYIDRGGGLVGGHDILWRRVRSLKLQEAFGGQLKRFRLFDEEPVPYKISPEHEDHPLREGLPDEFSLADGEVCWGEWSPEAEPVYVLGDDPAHYLVVARSYSKGRLVWLNSGDRGDTGLCRSISSPEADFIKLLTNALRWVSDHSS